MTIEEVKRRAELYSALADSKALHYNRRITTNKQNLI